MNGRMPENSRISLFPRFQRYTGSNAKKALKLYSEVAKDNKISLVYLALSFVNSQDFVTSNIIGAPNMEQLKENINSTKIVL